MSWRAELVATWAVMARNAVMGVRNVFFFFELVFWPIVGVLSIGLMTRFLSLTPEQGMTIVLTTHYMREADELCDEIGFIKAGRIIAQGTADALKRQMGLGYVVALKLEPRPAWLAEAPGVLRCVDAGDGWIDCTVDDPEKRVPELLRAFMKEGVEVRNLQVREPELEEVFVELAR